MLRVRTELGLVVLYCALQAGCSRPAEPARPEKPAPNTAQPAIPAPGAPAVPLEPIQALPETLNPDLQKAALGELLFSDKILSGDNKIACATCHMLKHGGADPRKSSKGIHGQNGSINAPTILNTALSIAQFWDGRAKDLQEQAADHIVDPLAMGSSLDEVVKKLQSNAKYSAEFARLYPDAVTPNNITNALAEYEKYLLTPSRFDQYLRGKTDAITDAEKTGYEVFKEVGCTSCHTGPLIGGGMFQKMGLLHDYFGERGTPITQADLGRFNVTKDPADKYFFKVPTLRNVELTAPYLHDATRTSLEETVTTMGNYQLGRTLSPEQVSSIFAFLKSLTGELPPALNKKKG